MKKIALFALCCLLVTGVGAQRKNNTDKLYCVAFYNIENFFDTSHDQGKDDQDFTPEGKLNWTKDRYDKKLKNITRVLGEIGRSEVPEGPAFIGIAEVEKRSVLEDIVSQPTTKKYRFVHYEGDDHRGIDCALLYDPGQYQVVNSKLFPYIQIKGEPYLATRGFLYVDGRLNNERVCVIVNHWPSRNSEEKFRLQAASRVRAITDSVMRSDPKVKVVVMGDLNDDPMDRSLQVMRARKWMNKVKKREFYNPWWTVLEDKHIGTLTYKGKWNLFDQILISESLLFPRKGLAYDHCWVFKPDYLLQKEERFRGTPHRNYAGKRWLNGYSDHLPTIVYFKVK